MARIEMGAVVEVQKKNYTPPSHQKVVVSKTQSNPLPGEAEVRDVHPMS